MRNKPIGMDALTWRIRLKRNRWIVICIIVINIFIICGCVFLLARQDNTAPEFRFQTSDYTYLKSDGEKPLLQNILAYDDQDGNITERIVIEKIVENQDNSTAVVYYAVSDMAGNVTKVSRIFPMEPSDEVPEYVAEQRAEAAESGADSTAGTEEESGSEDGTAEKDQETEDGEDLTQETEEADGEAEEEDDRDEVKEEPETAEPEQVKTAVDKSGYPVLTLKKKEVTIEAGTSPPWTELIETMRDDKDDYAALYYNLHISKFTSGKAGDYPVTLQAEDSDGNLSDPVTVTVHVR